MANIGSFGKSREQKKFQFTWFGVEIRVNPDLSELVLQDFAEEGSTLDEDDPRAYYMVKNMVKAFIHTDDFAEFWRISIENRQNSEDLMELIKGISEAVADRPTSLPSDSPAGQSGTAPKSKEDSFSRVLHREDGRPDRQLAIVDAQQARAAG